MTELTKIIVEIYNRPESRFKRGPLMRGFQYDIEGQPKQEKFYGVGCRTSWYQWNCPTEIED